MTATDIQPLDLEPIRRQSDDYSDAPTTWLAHDLAAQVPAVRGGGRLGNGGGDMTTDPFAGVDAYVRPPDGRCYCGGCIGMGPCDDDLGRDDEDDDGWFLDHDHWNDEDEEYR